MQFNVTVGNPPYNKDIYLDFIDISYILSNKYTILITPAKWQTNSDNARVYGNITYKKFREKYVSHIKYVVFYPDCSDVFLIKQVDGITYTLLDKRYHEFAVVENKCENSIHLNSMQIRDIKNRETLLNIGNDIINDLGDYERFKFNNSFGRYKVYTVNKMNPGRGKPEQWQSYGLLSYKEGNLQVLGRSKLVDIENKNNILELSESYVNSYSSDSKQECLNFISWLYTKFIRFFIFININKLTGIICDDNFRFVPKLKSGYTYDHIYTDSELYKMYNINDRYIEVIESIIRERDYINEF